MIEKQFVQSNLASIVFDPIPSYGGYWFFAIDNLRKNSKLENGINLWDEFYKKTYQEPIELIFKTSRILDFKVGMVSKPNVNNIGRSLHYSKRDFFVELTNFLSQNIDNYGLSEQEIKSKTDNLISYINKANDDLNIAYSDALKDKMKRLKGGIDKEFNSDYFEAAMIDYAPYKSQISFTEYINSLYDATSKYQMGLLRMGDFFDKNIDFNELYKIFDPDIFYLLFAKIIYDFNLESLKESNTLPNCYRYLAYYKIALENIAKDNVVYCPKIVYFSSSGEEIRYSTWEYLNELEELTKLHPELNNVRLPKLDPDDNEEYKDITLMNKLHKLNEEDVKNNWVFLNRDEQIKQDNVNSPTKEVNLRIHILENSGFVGKPLKGLNTYLGYFAFIYSNGLVIIENLGKDLEGLNEKMEATYIISIDTFMEFSKQSSISLSEYMKTLPDVKRIFHTSINNWQRNLFDIINGKYRLEDAIDFINSIQSDGVKHDK